MIAPRWRKVLRDIQERPGRSLLAVLAMAAGVFEIGALLYKYAVLQPVLTTMFEKTHPASAVLVTDSAGDALIDSVRRVPGVADAEARPVVMARMRVGEEWKPSVLYVVRDFDRQRMDYFRSERGAWPPGAGDVLLERSALSVAGAGIGDRVTVRTIGGDEHTVRVAGTVHAPGLPPAWMEHMVTGFVAWDAAVLGPASGVTEEIRIVVSDHPLDEGHIHEVADSVKAMLERGGHTVTRTTVPTPGRHPHADQMDAFLYLLLAFGILSFVLSAVLVASMVTALLAEQVRQVGIMKAIGASTRQIAGLYLGQISILAAASIAIGLPPAIVVGRAYARFSAGILNADISRSPFPWWAVVVVIVAGFATPLAFALGPVRRASRITVHRALNDDIGPRPFGSRRFERWLARGAWLPRPLMLSLRTTLVRRGRLALTVGTLAAGGAVFMSAMNVSGAWTQAVENDFGVRHYDLTIQLASPTPITTLRALLATQPDVVHAEYWPDAGAYLFGPDGVPGGTLAVLGPDPGSALLDLPILAGRRLAPGDSSAAVINQAVVAKNPKLRVGEPIRLRIKGKDLSFPIVGIVKELAPMPVVYAPPRAVLAASGKDPERARTIRIVTTQHDDASQRATARRLEAEFQRREIEVAGMQRMLDMREGILDHLVIIKTVLLLAAIIVVLVGALGLTSTMTLNVVQRTREIGVLGAIGATPGIISLHVWLEGLLIGVMSWVVANLLAAPVGYGIGAVVGGIFFKAPLDFYMSPWATALWLGLVVVLGSLSSVYPAARATRLTVREALNHA